MRRPCVAASGSRGNGCRLDTEQDAIGVAGQLARSVAEKLKLRQEIFLGRIVARSILFGVHSGAEGTALFAGQQISKCRARFFAGTE